MILDMAELNDPLMLNSVTWFRGFVAIRELGIGIVAYSPLGRGFLSSGTKMMETLAERDSRKVCTSVRIFIYLLDLC